MIKSDLDERVQGRIADFQRLQAAGLINLKGEFFPSVHYPPITMYQPVSEEALFASYSPPPDGLFSVYVHFPFCERICTFCHFVVTSGASPEAKDHYLAMLEKELDIYQRRFGLAAVKARSVLIGGGTPTDLSPAQLERFLRFFTSQIDLSACTQFSYDVDPATIIGPQGAERLRLLKDHGVSRLTIGIQSLDDAILRSMNRPHDAAQAIRSVQEARQAGFKVDIEFIYGYPGLSLEKWRQTMTTAVSLGAEEIQLYRLKIIPYGDLTGAIVGRRELRPDEFPPARDSLAMKETANSILEENGYKENLRRVFSKDPKDYSHYAADVFWRLKDQLGLGLRAYSTLRDRFVLGVKDFKDYYALINKGKPPVDRGLVRNPEDQLRWCLIQPLKCKEVNKKLYAQQTGARLDDVFRPKIERLKDSGLLYEDEKVLRLTPLGDFFADEVCMQFYHPRYLPFPRDWYANGILNPHDE